MFHFMIDIANKILQWINKIHNLFDNIKNMLIFAEKFITVMLPCYCPSCKSQLTVKCLCCDCCETEVTGNYELPVLTRLPAEEQDFVLKFVKHSGSLKDMARLLNLSYPTVRNLLNEIIEKLESYEK
jgi:hypothetical protein